MQDYKLIYGLMDNLQKSMDRDQIIYHFTSIADQLPTSNQKDDWTLAIMHWEQTHCDRTS